MFLDLDHFKEVNDTLGHDAGDRLLVDVAGRLRRCLRETDTAARLGGDEFVVVCEGLSAPEQAAIGAGRIARALRTEVTGPHHAITVTVSVGVATSQGTSAPADLLREADAAMYRAKERGRARYEFAETAPAVTLPRGTTLAPEAIAPAAVTSPARYEPAVDLGTGEVTAVEARAASRAQEAAGLGGALDRACRDAVAWRSRLGDAAPALWVDAPVRELGRGTVVDRVARALATSGLPPHRLSLEVPERHLLGFGPSARADLAALGELGVRIAVDDARGAIATWPHLDRVPVHLVKIGASIVAGVGTRRVDGALVSGIVALGHALDLRVVATGVATGGQRQALRSLGCDLAQGDAVHEPVSASGVETGLATARP